MIRKWSWVIPDQYPCHERADQLIVGALKNQLGEWDPSQPEVIFTRSKLQNWISLGWVKIESAPIESKQILQAGTRLEIIYQDTEHTLTASQGELIEILYEDEHLVVINKPAGLTVHPSPTQTENTLVHALLSQVKTLSLAGGPLRPGIVHRLDKNTSGAMVVSKSDAAHFGLIDIFSKHSIERKYWALCYGALSTNQSITIKNQIGRNPADRKKMTILAKGGKPAITHIQLLEKFGKSGFASWIEATLETGRTHQVRVHLTSLGCSLLGDPTYGTPTSKASKWLALPERARSIATQLPGQALHARSLGFLHPISKTPLHFEAKPPQIFTQLVEALR